MDKRGRRRSVTPPDGMVGFLATTAGPELERAVRDLAQRREQSLSAAIRHLLAVGLAVEDVEVKVAEVA